MKNKQVLPIPFLVLILAGVISLVGSIAGRSVEASTAHTDSLQVQTVEQERLAEYYFRVLSWLSDVTTPSQRVKANPQRMPKVMKNPQPHGRSDRIEYCAFHDMKHPVAIARCFWDFN